MGMGALPNLVPRRRWGCPSGPEVRRRAVTLVGVVMPLLAACGGSSAPSDQVSAACDNPGRLVLDLESTTTLEEFLPPRDIEVMDGAAVLVAQSGAIKSQPSNVIAVPGLPRSALRGVTRTSGVITYTDNTATRLDRGASTWEALGFDPPLRSVRTLEGTDEGGDLWVVSGPEAELIVGRYAPAGELTYRIAHRWKIPGDWRIIPGIRTSEDAILIATKPPFDVTLLSQDGVEDLGSLRGLDGGLDRPDSSSTVILAGALALDCGRLLLTLSDLRSTSRRILVVAAANLMVELDKRVDEPMAFFSVDRASVAFLKLLAHVQIFARIS